MKLRWLVTRDNNGQKTEPRLQYWHESGFWKDVGFVECHIDDESEYEIDPERD
jgi:hypothetical protein